MQTKHMASKRALSFLLVVLALFSPMLLAVSPGESSLDLSTAAYAVEYTYTYYPKCDSQYTSFVDALKSINVNSSYSNRKSIAALNGISNYTGAAAQNTKLLNLLKQGKLVKSKTPVPVTSYYPKYTGNAGSLVDALKALNIDSSYSYRKTIAAANGISNYTGTSSQNSTLLKLLKQGKLVKPGSSPTPTPTPTPTPNPSNDNVQQFQQRALSNWVRPVRASYLTIKGTGRAFGAARNGRNHAAIDYYVRNGAGTAVYAMQSGTVTEYSANFYYGTQAIAVQHADGSIARYCEIATSLRRGNKVVQGQKIGTMKANTYDKGTMLHLELYLGTAKGSLTNTSNKTYDYVSGNFNRRRDLLDPTFLLDLK